jgi:Flp pilus assembly protein TadG
MKRSNLLTRFKEDERGIATIESLLWMPLFFYLFILITDVSFIFYGKAQALRIIQDGNRAYATNLMDLESARARIEARLDGLALGSEVTSMNYSSATGLVTTTARMPAASLMAVGSIPQFINLDVNITEQHYREQGSYQP